MSKQKWERREKKQRKAKTGMRVGSKSVQTIFEQMAERGEKKGKKGGRNGR